MGFAGLNPSYNSSRQWKFDEDKRCPDHKLVRCRQLTEFELFGNDPVGRHAERPELSGEVRNETDLATQHDCIVLQGRDIGCDLRRSDSPTLRRRPERIVYDRLGLQVSLADFRIVDRVLFIADDIVEPDAPEIAIGDLKSKHTEERRDANACADTYNPAKRGIAMGGEPAEWAVDIQRGPRFERG